MFIYVYTNKEKEQDNRVGAPLLSGCRWGSKRSTINIHLTPG